MSDQRPEEQRKGDERRKFSPACSQHCGLINDVATLFERSKEGSSRRLQMFVIALPLLAAGFWGIVEIHAAVKLNTQASQNLVVGLGDLSDSLEQMSEVSTLNRQAILTHATRQGHNPDVEVPPIGR